MYEVLGKIIILLCCLSLYIFHYEIAFAVIPMIITILLSCLFLYFEDKRIRIIGILCYFFLCFIIPSYMIFLPILLLDIFLEKYQYAALLLPILLFYHYAYYSPEVIIFSLINVTLAFLLKYMTVKIHSLTSEYNELRDNASVVSLLLEQKNQSLLKNQDYEINLATLNERNRISKELHDSIGHLLSRALLQVGALLTLVKEEPLKEGLSNLKNSLSDGMDQVRNSIHHMHDESIDLYMQMNTLVKEFIFCQISLEYDIKTAPNLIHKYCFIAIVKEALANIIRHSNATKVIICLREHPAMYQLIIQDNGTMEENKKASLSKRLEQKDFGDSMGLRNMYDRIKGFQGNIHISLEQGFKIFLTIPK